MKILTVGSRVVPYGQTNMTELIVAFRNFANAPQKPSAVSPAQPADPGGTLTPKFPSVNRIPSSTTTCTHVAPLSQQSFFLSSSRQAKNVISVGHSPRNFSGAGLRLIVMSVPTRQHRFLWADPGSTQCHASDGIAMGLVSLIKAIIFIIVSSLQTKYKYSQTYESLQTYII